MNHSVLNEFPISHYFIFTHGTKMWIHFLPLIIIERSTKNQCGKNKAKSKSNNSLKLHARYFFNFPLWNLNSNYSIDISLNCLNFRLMSIKNRICEASNSTRGFNSTQQFTSICLTEWRENKYNWSVTSHNRNFPKKNLKCALSVQCLVEVVILNSATLEVFWHFLKPLILITIPIQKKLQALKIDWNLYWWCRCSMLCTWYLVHTRFH